MLTTRLCRAAALAAVATLLVPAAAAAAARPAAVQDALERAVAAGAPGAVALAGDRTFAAGVADAASGRPLRAGDRVRIGSVTKSFVAVVALQLVGEGRLRLDDTLGRRLPGVLSYGDDITPLIGHDGDVPGFSIVALSDRYGRRQAVVAVNMKFAAPAVDAAFDEAVDAAGRLAFGG
jgi:D-alanyl-D-alanine carboxypeptidase